MFNLNVYFVLLIGSIKKVTEYKNLAKPQVYSYVLSF